MHATDLRVALFSGNYNYVRDGANQAQNLLVGHLMAQGVTVRVYSPTTDTPAFAPTGTLVKAPSFAFPGRGEYKLGRYFPKETRADVEAFAPNIIHVSAPEFLGHGALTYARENGIASVAALHTRFETYFRYYHIGFVEPLIQWMLVRFYNRADRVLVPSPSMGTLLRGWGVTTPIGIWSRGIDHDRFSPTRRDMAWRRSLGIDDDEMVVGFLGRLVKEKGLRAFAEVVKELRRRGVRHRVLVVGEGPARQWFARQVPDAVFTGFQSGEALGRAVASMDIFFNPSETETFGNVTTEAMAAAVPVVAARATGAVDLIEEGRTGFLVPPRDIGAYADAIERIVTEPAFREAMGRAGHAEAARYRWDRANQAVLDQYLALIDQKKV
ncbi:glycosyltransferase family 1 protein [Sphingomonas bacterium]|uniref:glycosyltransferase family 4 protein n=1 Tax=Sphingomonas bacterium TaxID=1895847 RepID=UPI001575B248|nr:glycosyltransferase family 1 protein [Sphingomonas bacterium]